MTDQRLQRDLQTLDATVATWTDAQAALSRRVSLTEAADDRQDGELTDLVSRVADLEGRAIFAQRLAGDTVTLVIRVQAADSERTIRALLQEQLGRLAFEILR